MFVCDECQRTIYWQEDPVLLDFGKRKCCQECWANSPHVLVPASPHPNLIRVLDQLYSDWRAAVSEDPERAADFYQKQYPDAWREVYRIVTKEEWK